MTLGERTRLTGRRVGGYLIDVVILMAVLIVVQLCLWQLGLNWALRSASPWALQSWVFVTVTLPSLVYYALGPVLAGGTVGHRLLGLMVTPRPALVRAAARAAIMLIPFEANHFALFHGGMQAGAPNPGFWIAEGVTYGVLALLLLSSWLSRDGRGLHDRIGGLSVVLRA